MDAMDKDYIALMFSDAYKNVVGDSMQYVVCSSTRNAYNESVETFDELNATTVYGFTSTLQANNPDIEVAATGRFDALVTFVVTPLLEKGLKPKYGDAIDIVDGLGTPVRYIVSGFKDKNEHVDIFARLFVTRKDKV